MKVKSINPWALPNNRGNGYWDVRIAGERIELTADEVEKLQAAAKAREDESHVVTRRGEAFTGKHRTRYLPKRAEKPKLE